MIPLPPGRWWHRGLDLVTGCSPVSPACKHCWSAQATWRKGHSRNPQLRARYAGLTTKTPGQPACFTGEVRPQWDFLDRLGKAREPQVYTFWNDLFHPGIEDDDFIVSVLLRIIRHPQHFYIICTKRPDHALKFFYSVYSDFITPDPDFWAGRNVKEIFATRLMLMTTVERPEYLHRVETLLQIPGVRHGVSYEPALGPVDFRPFLPLTGNRKPETENRLSWLTAGGETGPYARPSHPDWFRQARDQAVAAGVPFFFKGWGKYCLPLDSHNNNRLLDGRTYEEVPFR